MAQEPVPAPSRTTGPQDSPASVLTMTVPEAGRPWVVFSTENGTVQDPPTTLGSGVMAPMLTAARSRPWSPSPARPPRSRPVTRSKAPDSNTWAAAYAPTRLPGQQLPGPPLGATTPAGSAALARAMLGWAAAPALAKLPPITTQPPDSANAATLPCTPGFQPSTESPASRAAPLRAWPCRVAKPPPT